MRTARWIIVCIVTLLHVEAEAQVTCPSPPSGVPVAACGHPAFTSCSIDVGGIPRHYCIHVPAAPAAGLPVVFGFHGGGGMASRAVNWMDEHVGHGLILVAPTALPSGADCDRRWRHLGHGGPGSGLQSWADFGGADACDTPIGPWPAHSPNDADLAFIDALLATVDREYETSESYAFGFSNGAGMVLQLLITEPFASRFEGYALIANGINAAKRTAQAGGGFGPYAANRNTPRPTMLIWGTADKTSFPSEVLIDRVNELAATAPPPAECVPPLDTPERVVRCWLSAPVAPGLPKFTLVSRIQETGDWLVDFNGADQVATESFYPDGGPDATLVARQDYAAGTAGAHVAVLTVLGGEHVVPGANAGGSCAAHTCDLDAVDEILAFWRTHAGLTTTTTAYDVPTEAPTSDHFVALHPNPFREVTTVEYEVTHAAHVVLDVFDLAGRRVRTLVAAEVSAGTHRSVWDGTDDAGRPVASGTYVLRLRVGEGVETRRVLLVR